jgi:tripartite-type tricarboxylate transporter receptor subunit TctC
MSPLTRAVLAAALSGIAVQAVAQLPAGYPSRPIRFIVGFSPGGANDIVARQIGAKLSENIGQMVVIDNRPGANTAIAAEIFLQAPADGYNIMHVTPGHTTNPAMMKLKFDPIKDFQFITIAAESQNLLVVHPTFPPRSVKDLIALSKQRPGDVDYGSSGIGTTAHLSAELFQYMTGVKWVHIPYKGGGQAMIELLRGTFPLYFGAVPSLIPHVRAGKFRPLAVTSLKRSDAAPDIPTVHESGVPGFEVTTWYGYATQTKVPRAIVDKLNAEIAKVLNSKEMRETLAKQGAMLVANAPEEATKFVEREIAKWTKVIRAAGIKAN